LFLSSIKVNIDLKQIGASQAMKAMMKDSIVDANGKSISFAAGKDGHVGMASVDGQTKISNGKTTTLNNDVITLNNTDAKTQNQLDNTNGNKQEAANRTKTRDRLEYESSPKNQVLDAGTDLIHKLTPQEQQENTAAIAGTMGTMAAGVAGIYAASQIDKKFNPELDENGKKTGRGAWGGKVQDKLRSVFSPGGNAESISDTEKQPTHNSDHSQPNKSDDKKGDNGTHDKSFNSDKDSMPNNSKSVNSEKGFSQGKTTDGGIHVPDNFDLSDPHTTNNKSWAGKIQDAMSGSGNFRTKLSLTAGTMALGYGVDAQAREISPSPVSTAAKAMPREEEGFLKQASDTLGNMELVGGLTTLAAEGASKFRQCRKRCRFYGCLKQCRVSEWHLERQTEHIEQVREIL